MTCFSLIYLLKAWSLNTVMLGIRALTYGFEVGSHNSDIQMFIISQFRYTNVYHFRYLFKSNLWMSIKFRESGGYSIVHN